MSQKTPIRIFIVDDDKLLTAALEQHIKNQIALPFEIKIFHNGNDVLKRLYDNKPDIVFLDYNFGKNSIDNVFQRNGLSVLKKLMFRCPYTTVVMISSQKNINIANETIENGAVKYIEKNEEMFPSVSDFLKTFIAENTIEKKIFWKRLSDAI